MDSLLRRLLKEEDLEPSTVRAEHERLAERLDILRHNGEITIDAFLAAGAIQGGLEVLATLVGLEVDPSEVTRHLNSMIERAQRIEEVHSGLDAAIEQQDS